MSRRTMFLALLVSASAGVGAGVLFLQADTPDRTQQDASSITGVSSGVDGSQVEPPEKDGVDQVPLTLETTPSTDQNRPPSGMNVGDARGQAVDLEGVEGTEGVDTESEYTIDIITTNDGSMQSIRGIKGIDTVLLQNLESVLRMQAPPPPPVEGGGGGGGVRAAAALLTTENEERLEPEQEIDGREELTEFEFEGS